MTLRFVLLALLCTIGAACAQEPWPSIFDPFRVRTINIEIDPQKWEAIKKDTNYYDPALNIREPCWMWVTGTTAPNTRETAIRVQIRRKSDPALPSETDPQKVSLKIDVNEYVAGQELFGIKKISLENGSGNGVLKEGFAMNLHRMAGDAGFYDCEAGNAAWVRLVVNGQYVGLYTSPEQRDVTLLKNRGRYRQGASWLYEINGGIFLDDSVATTDSPTHAQLNYYPFRGPNNPPSNFESEVQRWVDMRAMLTMAALEGFSVNSDGLIYKSASNQGKNSFCMDFLPSTQNRRKYICRGISTRGFPAPPSTFSAAAAGRPTSDATRRSSSSTSGSKNTSSTSSPTCSTDRFLALRSTAGSTVWSRCSAPRSPRIRTARAASSPACAVTSTRASRTSGPRSAQSFSRPSSRRPRARFRPAFSSR